MLLLSLMTQNIEEIFYLVASCYACITTNQKNTIKQFLYMENASIYHTLLEWNQVLHYWIMLLNEYVFDQVYNQI